LFVRLGAIALLAALLTAAPFHAAFAQAIAPDLGNAQSFAVLGASAVTNSGPTVITGNLGIDAGTSVTGFPPGTVLAGSILGPGGLAGLAQDDNTAAFGFLAGQSCPPGNTFAGGADLAGLTLSPGVYCSASTLLLTGTLTLDALGDTNAVWIFQIGSSFSTTGPSAVVKVIGGGQNCNVFWQVGSSATLDVNTTFIGSILASTSISLNTGATLSGRALAQTGAVTMLSNTVGITACAVPPVGPIPPTLNKAFTPATINEGGISNLSITLTNPDPTAPATVVSLTDTLPTNVVVTNPVSGLTDSCGLGFAPAAGASSVALLSGGIIPAGGSCTVTVNVTSAVAGTYNNQLGVGALVTSNGSNALPAVAPLDVTPFTPPQTPFVTISKAFSPTTINAGTGNASTLTITLSNPNTSDALLSFPLTDTLPPGMFIASAPGTTCGGAVNATLGGSTVTLAADGINSIPGQRTCTVTVDVTAPVAASYFNTILAGALITNQGTNPGPAEATLAVIPIIIVPPPTVGKVFSPDTIYVPGGPVTTSTLSITLSNPSNSPSAIVPFVDILPAGVVFASPDNASTNCPLPSGVVAATNLGISTVTLTGGGMLQPGGSCTVTVDVTATVAGDYTNHLGNITAILHVLPITPAPALSLTKTANPTTYTCVGQVITYTYVITNTGNVTLTGPFKVTDDKLGKFQCGTATSLASGASVTCTKTYKIQACNLGCVTHPGSIVNHAKATNGSVYSGQATATVNQNFPPPPNKPPKLTKSFCLATIKAGGVSTLTITLTNPNSTVAELDAPLTDYLPYGVEVAAGTKTNTCGGTLTANKGDLKVTLGSDSSIPANRSCTVTVKVTAKKCGSYCNTLPVGALKTNKGNNAAPASATLNVTR
jgi:hypothetical protein